MDGSAQEKSYHLVFDGRLVPGRSAQEVEAVFVERFGAATAKNLFSGKSVTLNRDLDRADAQKKQRVFEKLGIVVQLVPSSPDAVALSLVDEPEKPAANDANHATAAPEAEKVQKADFGSLPDRSRTKPAENPGSDVYSIADIAKAFGKAPEFPPASSNYVVKLVPVTALMLLLPLLYIGITAFSGYGTYWVAVEGFNWFANNPGYVRLISACAALLGSFLLTLFLLRPLFAQVDQGPQPVRLDPSREPILFDLVERITDAVGAPMPDEILVDSEANASARLTHGVFSKGLTLTIGMPLVYGLDLQSLTGVLAHEFGHFTQRVGMRSSALVHRINYWFYGQVHERDNWDRFVEKWLATENIVLTLAAILAQFGSFLVRLLLHLLSTLAALFSFSLSRQMEFDADRYEIGLVGSKAYEKTAAAMRILCGGYEVAMADVQMAFDSDKKVDNLPRLAALKAENFTAKERQTILSQIEEVNESIFDTHPSDQARIRKAVDADMPACFSHAGSATKLLREPDRLSKLVTLQWYRSFGVEVTPEDLIPLQEFASESDLLKNAEESIRLFFGSLDNTTEYLPLVAPGNLAKLDDTQLQAAHHKIRDGLDKDKMDFLRLRKQMDEDIEYQLYYRQALFWRRAGFDIDLNAYRLPLTTADVSEITKKLARYRETESESRAGLRRCIELQGQRLSVGLEFAVRGGEVERDEVDTLRRAYAAMASTATDVTRLNECGEQIDLLLQILEALPDDAKYKRQLNTNHATNQQLQRRIRNALGTVADPFAKGEPLADVLPNDSGDIAESGDRNAVAALDDAARMLRSLARTSYKTLGRMTEIAVAAEPRH